MFGLGFTELIIVLVVALLVFGPKNLPQIGKAIGKGIHEFKKAAKGAYTDDDETEPEQISGHTEEPSAKDVKNDLQ
jgi:sec-independent protein translocase protein TatA